MLQKNRRWSESGEGESLAAPRGLWLSQRRLGRLQALQAVPPSRLPDSPLDGGIRPKATVQVTHGITEHSGRYDRFARFLAARGYVVYAIDLRAH